MLCPGCEATELTISPQGFGTCSTCGVAVRITYPMKNAHRYSKRFWAQVKIAGPDECWEWQGAKTTNGAGAISINGHTVGTHRFALYLETGVYYPRLHVLHSCDHPPCVNPKHLRYGTAQENMDDKYKRGRGNHPSGANHWRAKRRQDNAKKNN